MGRPDGAMIGEPVPHLRCPNPGRVERAGSGHQQVENEAVLRLGDAVEGGEGVMGVDVIKRGELTRCLVDLSADFKFDGKQAAVEVTPHDHGEGLFETRFGDLKGLGVSWVLGDA